MKIYVLNKLMQIILLHIYDVESGFIIFFNMMLALCGALCVGLLR